MRLKPVIVHLWPSHFTVGGAQRFCCDLANWASAFCDVHIIYRYGTDDFWQSKTNATFHRIDTPEATLAKIHELQPDLIHHQYPYGGFLVPELEGKYPLIGTPHGWTTGCSPETRLADWVIPINGGWPDQIRLGIDLDRYKVKAHHNQTQLVVGVVGRRGKEKYPDSFLSRLEQGLPQGVTIKIIGDGWPHENRDKITARLENIKGVELVGDVPQDLMPIVYQGLDCLLVPSAHENTPYVAIEAMASGLPVVARNVDGLPSCLGAAGVLFDTDDQAFEKLIELRNDPRQRKQLGARGRARAEACFDLRRMLEDYNQAYSRLTQGAVRQPDTTLDCSVIMAVYNTPSKWLRESIDSVLSQEGRFELIVVDDGSTSLDTRLTLRNYGSKINLITLDTNQGGGAARNEALRAAKSDLILVHDSDDVMLPGRIKTQVEYMRANPDVALHSGWLEKIDGNGNPLPTQHYTWDKSKPLWQQANPFAHSACAYRRQAAFTSGLYPANTFCQDYWLWCSMEAHGYKLARTDEVLYKYRWIDWDKKRQTRLDSDRWVREYFATLEPAPPEQVTTATEGVAMLDYSTGGGSGFEYPCMRQPITCTGQELGTHWSAQIAAYYGADWDNLPATANDGTFLWFGYPSVCGDITEFGNGTGYEWFGFSRVYVMAGYVFTVGYLRFYNDETITGQSEIPVNAIIKKAQIKMRAKPAPEFVNSNYNTATIKVRVYAGDLQMPQPTVGGYEMCLPFDVTNQIEWTVENWQADQWYTTPDLSCIVQEFLDGDFTYGRGRSINFYFVICDPSSTTSDLSYRAYDWSDDPASAPILEVWYIPKFTAPALTGGIVFIGSNEPTQVFVGRKQGGSLVFSGESIASVYRSYVGQGQLTFSGESEQSTTCTHTGHGQLTFSGTAPTTRDSYGYTGRVEIVFNGECLPNSIEAIVIPSDSIFHNGFKYRQLITIPKGTVNENLNNFTIPVSIILPPDKVETGLDIAFELPDETQLPSEIEYYNNTTGELLAWVQLSIPTNNDISFFVYFGKPQVSSGSNPWDCVNVYHLSENGTTDEYKDSAGDNDGRGGGGNTSYVPDQITGKLGYAQEFDGNDSIVLGSDGIATTSPITVSAWITIDSFLTQQRVFFSRGVTRDTNGCSLFVGHDMYGKIWAGVRTVNADLGWGWHEITGTTKLVPDTWYHVAIVWMPGVGLKNYINGQLDQSLAVSDTQLVPSTNYNVIGKRDGQYLWLGNVDELRVDDSARSTEWIRAEYAFTNDFTSFYTIRGVERSVGFTGDADARIETNYTGSGDLSLLGQVLPRMDYAFSGSGQLTFLGDSASNFLLTYAGSSGIAFDGAAGSLQRFIHSGSGGLTFVGEVVREADYVITGSGQLAFSGESINQLDTDYTGQGAVSLSGSGEAQPVIPRTGSGQLTLMGYALTPQQLRYVGSGQLSISGDCVKVFCLTHGGSGQITFSGASTNQLDTDYTGQGDLSFIGQSERQAELLATGSGQLALSGESSGFLTLTYTGSSGIGFDGAAESYPILAYDGRGQLIFSGESQQHADFSILGLGRILFAGSATGNTMPLYRKMCFKLEQLPTFGGKLEQLPVFDGQLTYEEC